MKKQRDSIYCYKCQAWKDNYKEFAKFIVCADCGDKYDVNKINVIRAQRPMCGGGKERV